MSCLKDLAAMFFPGHCLVCGKNLPALCQEVLCLKCEYKMPRTDFRLHHDNPVSQLFWGKADIESATALFKFEKGSAYQVLLHELKYRGNRMAGRYLGRMLGEDIKKSPYGESDLIIPVPLHPKRLRQRGYNQGDAIAEGVSAATGIPVDRNIIRRIRYQQSQTHKGRLERFRNMDHAFRLCSNHTDLRNKRLLLVDDVVTTGATLEACGQILAAAQPGQIFVATLSFA